MSAANRGGANGGGGSADGGGARGAGGGGSADGSGPPRVGVAKTYKMYVGGAFVRSESGHTFAANTADGAHLAHCCRTSRKDMRDAIKAARAAQSGWAARSAFNRSQILFRIAEVLEARRPQFEAALAHAAGLDVDDARAELDAAVDRTFWYAGWADKYAQVFGCTNPVASPHFDFSIPEPTGVVVAAPSPTSPLCGLVSLLLPVLVPGNTCVLLVRTAPTIAIDFAEVLATSDVPAGVVNVLTSDDDTALDPAASHRDVNALAFVGTDPDRRRTLEQAAAENVKRTWYEVDADLAAWRDASRQSPYRIAPFVETKTAWHPIGV